jgi:hypothetical protein
MNQVVVGRDTAPSLGACLPRPSPTPTNSICGWSLYSIKPLNAAGIYIITTVMAEHRGAKAPEETAEGLRWVGVVLYDTDLDQPACIACSQQWQATSLGGHWWHCSNGCNHYGL